MSTEHNSHGGIRLPLHEDVSFEQRDVRVTIILKFLVWMAVVIILSFGVSLGIYRGLLKYWNSTYLPPPPSRVDAGSFLPPEPRLQGMPGHMTDPQDDMRLKVQQDAAANESFAWIDQKAGIAQIPVSDAMKWIAEKGMPAAPAPQAEKKSPQ